MTKNAMTEKNPFSLLGKVKERALVTDKAKQLIQKFIDDMIQLQLDNVEVGARDTASREAMYQYVIRHCYRIAYPFNEVNDKEYK